MHPDASGWGPPPAWPDAHGPGRPPTPAAEPFPWARGLWTGILLGVLEGTVGTFLLFFVIVLAPAVLVLHAFLALVCLKGGRQSPTFDATGFGIAIAPAVAGVAGFIVVQLLVA